MYKDFLPFLAHCFYDHVQIFHYWKDSLPILVLNLRDPYPIPSRVFRGEVPSGCYVIEDIDLKE